MWKGALVACKNCEIALEDVDKFYPYRLGTAVLAIIGCREHVGQAIRLLTRGQDIDRLVHDFAEVMRVAYEQEQAKQTGPGTEDAGPVEDHPDS
jgi:hypothetical protein